MSRSPAALADHLNGHSSRTEGDFTERASMPEVDGHRLFTLTFTPAATHPKAGLVICHSFLELSMLQRTELDLGRQAARRGVACTYMQAPGAGDSEGAPELCTVERRVDTAVAAGALLMNDVPSIERVAFFGARLGGAIACLAAERFRDAYGLAVWDPVFDGPTYWKQARRLARVIAVVGRQRSFEDPVKELARKGWASMFGNAVTQDLVDDLDTISKAATAQVTGPLFVLSLNDAMVAATIERMSAVSSDVGSTSLGRPDMGHLGLRQAPEAIAPTLEWVTRKLT